MVAAAAVLIGGHSAAGREVVGIHLNGYYYTEPATVRIQVTIEPDEQNRTLRIEADGDRMFRSTEVTLVGDAEKRTRTIEFKNLAAGTYVLRAEVRSSSRVRGMAEQELIVAGR